MLHLRRGAAAWLAFHRQTKEGEAEVISRLVTNDISVAVHCCLLLEPQTVPGLRAGPRDSFRLLSIWLQRWKYRGILIFSGHGYCPLYLCEKFWCSDVCVRCAGGTQRGGAFLLVSVGMLTLPASTTSGRNVLSLKYLVVVWMGSAGGCGFVVHDLSFVLLASVIVEVPAPEQPCKVLLQYQIICEVDKRSGKECSRKMSLCQYIIPRIVKKKSSMWFENVVLRRHIGTKLGSNGPWI